jgi:hypothetical protein
MAGGDSGHFFWAWHVDREDGRYEQASARLVDALQVALDLGDRNLLAHALEGLSGVASALGQHQLGVHLGGAAAALREANGAPLGPAWQQVADRWLAISRHALGDDAASAAWAAGHALPTEQTLEELIRAYSDGLPPMPRFSSSAYPQR